MRAFVDIDSLVRRVYGHHGQGASYGHTKIAGKQVLRKGLSSLVVTISSVAAAPLVTGIRLWAGKSNSGKGAARPPNTGYVGGMYEPDCPRMSLHSERSGSATAGISIRVAARHRRTVGSRATDEHCDAYPLVGHGRSRDPSTAGALRRHWRHNGAMPSVQIKDVPEDTHAVLRRRAAAAHQSLQEYLRTRLIEEAAQPTLEEVLERAGGRAGGSVPLEAAVAAVRDDRARR
jgi:antitoxin FitA